MGQKVNSHGSYRISALISAMVRVYIGSGIHRFVSDEAAAPMYRHECLFLAIKAHLLHIDARKG